MNKLNKIINLRSDTVSHMSKKMMSALMNAQVGDDVYNDDPTLNNLQDHIANLFGKEKAILTLSGTMSNLISILVHCERGDSAILTKSSHINVYEQGNISSIAGVFPIVIPERSNGTVDLEEVKKCILPENQHFARTKLLCLENTQNLLSGQPLPLSFNRELELFKIKVPIKTHLDGSRLLNAYYFHKTTHPDLKVKDITDGFDSVSMCLSKALRCPLGSVLAGSEEFIKKAHRWRKALGGGFRQAGYIAAAALQSLQDAEKTIKKDHYHAKTLAKKLENQGVKVEKSDTNFVVFEPHTKEPGPEYIKRLEKSGILANTRIDGKVRFVLHGNIEYKDIGEVEKRMFSQNF